MLTIFAVGSASDFLPRVSMSALAPPVHSATAPPPTLAPTTLLECRDLSRFFGPFAALRRVNLRLSARRLVALLGPNGAGKSTLLKILGGALRPSEGIAAIAGAPWGSPAARRAAGLLAHESLLHPRLTVEENLRFYAALHNLPRAAPDDALARARGEALRRLPVGELSQGMRQKAALARCLLHRPRVLLLDEPFASLDRGVIAELQATLAELRDAGLLILLSTHAEDLVASLADGAARLERGRLITSPPEAAA